MAVLTTVKSMPEGQRTAYNDGWLGIMAAFALVWGLLNVAGLALTLSMDADALARSFSDRQVAYILDTPVWARVCHAVSVGALLVGAGYLQLRRASSYRWLMLSLFAMLGLFLDGVIRDGFSMFTSITTGLNLGYMIVGLFLFWAAHMATQEGQLH